MATSVSRFAKVLAVVIVSWTSSVARGETAPVAVAAEEREVDALVEQKRYLSAARFIEERSQLRDQPRFVRKLTHILTTGYAMAIDFRLFSLRDLEAGEAIEEVRGKPGTYTMTGGDLEQRLRDAIAAAPDDPELQYAVGEYLSRMSACGCGTPELFRGEEAEDWRWFERALRGGVSDAWSFFRLGTHQATASSPDHRAALGWFQRALALEPDDVDAQYNTAVCLFFLKEYSSARQHSERALGRYRNAGLDADAYHLHGAIAAALGDEKGAEDAWARALQLKPSNATVFRSLLGLLRSQRRADEYRRRAAAFVALDYANTWPFGQYLEWLKAAGVSEADRRLGRDLEARHYASDLEIGAVFYGLGGLAELDGDRALAHARYVRSLEALKKAAHPPPGAVDALTGLVERTQGDAR